MQTSLFFDDVGDPDEDDVIISSQLHPHNSPNRVKVINDPIHGHFELPGHVVSVLDTPHIQRLRDLKQLGGTYLVFPGASHNRFEHSVGVSHLSRALVTGLYTNNRDPLAKACYDNVRHFRHAVRLVELAGLCHDIGHGPYSHLFDHSFLPAVCGRAVADDHPLMMHEHRSVMLLKHMVDQYSLEISSEDVKHIGDLIAGKKHRGGIDEAPLKPAFLYDVVANGKSGIDTDKFDYLARDVYNVGLQGAYGFDHRRLMKFAKVVDDSICFHRKEFFNVYHLFLTRYQLHLTPTLLTVTGTVYNHRAAVSIDGMITDAFLEANSTLKIADSITDPAEFLTMTDSLVPIIERSKESSLVGARKIISRLRRRKLYRFVDEILLPAGVSRKITAEEITTCQDRANTGIELRPDDIYVAHVTLNFGMKSRNPVDQVLFFKDWEDSSPQLISSAKASYVIPAHFEEKIIRIYLKREYEHYHDSNRAKVAAKIAFRRFTERNHLASLLQSPEQSRKRQKRSSTGDAPDSTTDFRAASPDSQNPTTGLAPTPDERLAKHCKPSIDFEDGLHKP